jgi:hypothetical protein
MVLMLVLIDNRSYQFDPELYNLNRVLMIEEFTYFDNLVFR